MCYQCGGDFKETAKVLVDSCVVRRLESFKYSPRGLEHPLSKFYDFDYGWTHCSENFNSETKCDPLHPVLVRLDSTYCLGGCLVFRADIWHRMKYIIDGHTEESLTFENFVDSVKHLEITPHSLLESMYGADSKSRESVNDLLVRTNYAGLFNLTLDNFDPFLGILIAVAINTQDNHVFEFDLLPFCQRTPTVPQHFTCIDVDAVDKIYSNNVSGPWKKRLITKVLHLG